MDPLVAQHPYLRNDVANDALAVLVEGGDPL